MNTEIYLICLNMKTEKAEVSSSHEYLAWIKVKHDTVQEQIGSTYKQPTYILIKYYEHLRNITLASTVGLYISTGDWL